MPITDAVLACVQALYDAADDDSATGGPDLTRQIFPVIATITDDGFRRLSDAESAEYAQQVVRRAGCARPTARTPRCGRLADRHLAPVPHHSNLIALTT